MRWPSAENRYGISQLYIEGDAAGKVIGRVSLYHIGTGGPDDLGYPIAEPAQGRGVATAAARRAVAAAFEAGVTQASAKAISDNSHLTRSWTSLGASTFTSRARREGQPRRAITVVTLKPR